MQNNHFIHSTCKQHVLDLIPSAHGSNLDQIAPLPPSSTRQSHCDQRVQKCCGCCQAAQDGSQAEGINHKRAAFRLVVAVAVAKGANLSVSGAGF